MFCFKAGVFLDELKKYSLEVYETSFNAYNNANTDNVIGACVPAEDSKSLSDAFINILNDDAIYADYSKNALNRVNETYNKKIVINNLIAIYKKLIKESL
jgi:glycosyltransferase involved in cell wall biosynthesis